jgi:hypothetical protein
LKLPSISAGRSPTRYLSTRHAVVTRTHLSVVVVVMMVMVIIIIIIIIIIIVIMAAAAAAAATTMMMMIFVTDISTAEYYIWLLKFVRLHQYVILLTYFCICQGQL